MKSDFDPIPPHAPARSAIPVGASSRDCRLSDLAPGARARVTAVEGHGPSERRLMDLGLLPGTRVRAVRRAPLGDPVEFELRGYRLCLRRRDAACVHVRLEPAAP